MIGDPQRADGIEELGLVGVIIGSFCGVIWILGIWKAVELISYVM